MSDTLRARIARVQEALRADGADFLLIPPSADFRWLTGATARSTERLLLLVVPRDGDPFVLVPQLRARRSVTNAPGSRAPPGRTTRTPSRGWRSGSRSTGIRPCGSARACV
jgi:Xaa-Pro aminopeptidase